MATSFAQQMQDLKQLGIENGVLPREMDMTFEERVAEVVRDEVPEQYREYPERDIPAEVSELRVELAETREELRRVGNRASYTLLGAILLGVALAAHVFL